MSRDCCRSPSRNHYRLPSKISRCSSTPYYNMHYHQWHTPLKDGTLKVDTAQHGQTMFLTTLHFKTSSSQTTTQVKRDTGTMHAQYPKAISNRCFPTKAKAKVPSPKMYYCLQRKMDRSWQIPQKYLGHIILDAHYKTMGRSYPTRFYIFKDTTSPLILISYAASDMLGILQFKLPNKTASAQIDHHPLFRTIHHRTNAYKTILIPPSKNMITKLLKKLSLKPLFSENQCSRTQYQSR